MRRFWATAFLLACLGLAGCGKSNSDIEGTITYDGQPIDQGAVAFIGTGEGGTKGGGAIIQGKYRVPAEQNLAPGKYRVEVHWSKKNGKQFKSDSGEMLDDAREGLPDKYHTKSELTAEVKGGHNDINFDLAK